MKNLKNLVAAWLTVAGVASTQAQQVVKHVKDNTVKLFASANGTTLANTIGTKNIDIGNSDNRGNLTVFDPNNQPLNQADTQTTSTTLANETIGNTTFVRNGATQRKTTNTRPTESIQLSIPSVRARGDGDGDAGIEGIIIIRERPTLQNNGLPIPVNTKIRFTSPTTKNPATWQTLTPEEDIRFNRDWDERIPMTVRPGWSIPPVLQDRWTYLGTEEFNTFSEAVVYPNPTTGPLTIQTNNFNDKKVEIYNLSGQIISRMPLSGDTSTIDISSLATGPYILSTEDTDGNKTVNKIIKK